MTISEDPLDEAEWDELEAFLASDVAANNSMEISSLHGFLTALVSGPEVVMPSEWLPIVFGSREPSFIGEERAQRILGLIVRMHNEIGFTLTEQPATFEPILLSPGGKGKRSYGFAWCYGYLEGVTLGVDAWRKYFDEPTVTAGLKVIAHLATDAPGVRLPPGIRRADIPDVLSGTALSIHAFFLDGRRRERTVHRSSPRVSRNAPCPCGSGKKFKVCCGAA